MLEVSEATCLSDICPMSIRLIKEDGVGWKMFPRVEMVKNTLGHFLQSSDKKMVFSCPGVLDVSGSDMCCCLCLCLSCSTRRVIASLQLL